MNSREITYLTSARRLVDRQQQIAAMIANLKAICASLTNWQATAAQLSKNFGLDETWSDDRLKSMMSLRSALTEYQSVADEVQKLWNDLSPAERIGLAEPRALLAE